MSWKLPRTTDCVTCQSWAKRVRKQSWNIQRQNAMHWLNQSFCHWPVIKRPQQPLKYWCACLCVSGGYNPKRRTHRSMLLCLLMTSCDLSDQTKDWKTTRKIAVSNLKFSQMCLISHFWFIVALKMKKVGKYSDIGFKLAANSNSDYIIVH